MKNAYIGEQVFSFRYVELVRHYLCKTVRCRKAAHGQLFNISEQVKLLQIVMTIKRSSREDIKSIRIV